MMHSIGKSFNATVDPITIFQVPAGYVAHVSLVYITNTSGNTGSYNISWRHAHNNYADVIRFGYGKSLSSGSSDQFSQGILVMKSGDRMTITNGMAVDVIVSFDLLQAPHFMPLRANKTLDKIHFCGIIATTLGIIMAQTTYEEYLKQFGSAAAAQPTGMMQPTIAMPDVSAIENAVKNIKTVNDAYTIPERADLNKVREEFLAKKAQDSTAQLQSLINSRSTGGDGGNNADGSGGYLTGEMSDADFVSQMAYGIQNVQTLANMGLISQQTAQALINDAIAKAKAVDPQVLQTQDPAPVRDAITGAVTGKSGGTAYSGSFSGGWSDGGTGVGVGGGSVGAGGGNAAGGFSYGGW